jgi:hypothetical protein
VVVWLSRPCWLVLSGGGPVAIWLWLSIGEGVCHP